MAYKVYLSDDINVIELDTENIDINSVFAVSDITDITARKESIKTIQFKGTKTNNHAFGVFFDLGRTSDFNISNRLLFNYNPLRAVNTLVYEDSNLIFKGSLRISEINIDKNNGITYNTILTSALIDIKTIIQDKYLSDLDLSDLRHRYNSNSIINSWSASTERYNSATSAFTSTAFAYGSGYVYPNIDYGYFTGSTSVNDINIKNFKPSIYVTEYLNRIFNQKGLSGYTYEIKASPDFIESFNHLIIPDCQEGFVNTTSGITSSYSKPYPLSFTNSYPNYTGGNAATRLYPIANIVHPNPSLCGHLLEQDGTYSDVLKVKRNFKANGTLSVEFYAMYHRSSIVYSEPTGSVVNVKFKLVKRPYEANNNTSNWTVITESSISLTASTTPILKTISFETALIDFVEGEQVAVMFEQPTLLVIIPLPFPHAVYSTMIDITGNTGTLTIPASTNQVIQFDTNPSFTGSATYDIAQPLAPVNVKQIDFLKSLMNQFNFYAYSKNDNHKHLIFESYDDFNVLARPDFIKNQSLDWTNKIDYNQVKLKSNIDLPKSYLFTYKEDVDVKTDAYKKRFNQIYGQFSFNDEYGLTDTKKMELIFSPSINVSEAGTDRKYLCLYKLESNVKKLTKTNIRLAYYNGLQPCTSYVIGLYSANTMTTVYSGNTYPQVSNYYLSGSTVINDLHFNQPLEAYFAYGVDYSNASLNQNSYKNYYINEVTDLTNPDVVYIECQALLTEIDIANIDLKVPIYIQTGLMNSAYFKVLKVEYSGKDTLSKLSLQKIAF